MAKFILTRGDINAAQFAALFHERIELNFGAPRGVVSDRDMITSKFPIGQRFVSTKRRMSTAFHPQTDGQI
jgi:hypothetical protein